MLEYMLVRQEDAPIVDRSRGCLRWIVLDEAHTYVGSQAAELALLLRRVLHAFGVSSEDVRFIATSATIGKADDPRSAQRLREYLASIAGIDVERIAVISGQREIPELPAAEPSARLPELDALAAMTPRARYDALAPVPVFRALRQRLTEEPATLTELAGLAYGDGGDERRAQALRLLDLARHAVRGETPLLPLRGHVFHRTQRGLWACCSRRCPGRKGPLNDDSWVFGKTFIEHRERCDEEGCGGLVFEVALCSSCGAEYLYAQRVVRDGVNAYVPAPVLFEGEAEESFDDALEEEDDGGVSKAEVGKRRLLGPHRADETHDHAATRDERFERETGHIGQAGDVSLTEVGIRVKHANLYCANCGEGEQRPGDLLRPVRTSGPFHLSVAIPTLLEFSPAVAAPRTRPFAGRRTITFSDSRQGTARFALKAQLDAERNYVRSYVYHLVASRRPPASQREQDERQLAELESLPPGTQAVLASQIAALKQRLAGAGEGRIRWSQGLTELATSSTFIEWVAPSWRERFDSPARLAHFMLLREFARRPKLQNSLETLGLVRLDYAGLNQGLALPPDARALGLNEQDWRDLLKLLLDFVVRAQSAVVFDPPEMLRWMGVKIRPKIVVGPEFDGDSDSETVRWPQLRPGRRHRFVALIASQFKLDPTDEQHARTLQGLFAAAWTQLHELRLLQRSEHGSRIDLEHVAELTTVEHAWICPVTRRVLDTTFRGLSPFALNHAFLAAEPVQMPRLPHPFPQMGDALGAALPEGAIERWLETDARVCDVRARGVWSDFSDRIASFAGYYRIGEHSAQQSAGRLAELESEFKAGKLNLLSCSTTMEMGVDIGGLSTVAMNNAPPSPANFLQRAGRAGRRGETAAVSLTMCKSQPHGEQVFGNPRWPFVTPIHVPTVSLQSERIVQRHVNALLLTHFLQERNNDALRLTMQSFFEPPGPDASTPAEYFRAWLHDQRSEAVARGIKQLTAGSCLGGLEPQQLCLRTTGALEAVSQPWLNELNALSLALDEVGGPPGPKGTPSAAQLALQRQLERLRGEYLLSELATRGFLPAYGFPTGLVPFVQTNLEQLHRERRAREDRRKRRLEGDTTATEREDSPFRRGGYPTRSLPVAIREYAPGSAVVLDGVVHRSNGVTLNWHLPPGDQPPRELQAFRYAWRCKPCGAAGTSAAEVKTCEVCHSEVRPVPYLQPAGFAVQITERPTNILDEVTYIPVRDPWISAGRGVWCDLPRLELGRVRVTERGQLFYRSGGLHGEGYALCLHCGFAVSMPPRRNAGPPERPAAINKHRHLRGGRSPKGEAWCPGPDNPHAIRLGQFLGVSVETDVLELQLYNPDSQAPVNDEIVATTLAAALRHALAHELGVDDREIGWAQIPSVGRSDHQRGRSIVLFDTADGGAGYVAEAPRMLPKLLRAAHKLLDCPRGCDRACHACLLTFDTQHRLEHLDRKRALELLTAEYLAALELPSEMRVFDDVDERFELEPLPIALARELQRAGATDIALYLDGDSDDWDLEDWPVRDWLVRWALGGTRVALCIAPSTFEALHDTERSLLASLADLKNFSVHVESAPEPRPGAHLVAVASTANRRTRWASLAATSPSPGPDWASSLQLVASTAMSPASPPATPALKPAAIRRAPANTRKEIAIRRQFDGCPMDEFGRRFWHEIGKTAPGLARRLEQKHPLASIEYRDRYFCTPLVARAFYGLLTRLKELGVLKTSTAVKLMTESLDSARETRRPRNRINDNWTSDTTRAKVLGVLLQGIAALVIETKPKQDLEHARQLTLTWQDGQRFVLRLDEGFGFLEANVSLDVTASPEFQARRLLETPARTASVTRLRPHLVTYLYAQDV
jgi:DEAD/DEAH box helicase domain-containing protein